MNAPDVRELRAKVADAVMTFDDIDDLLRIVQYLAQLRVSRFHKPPIAEPGEWSVN